ncbi:MAG: hypoxanthine phosphoribosyltransferase [Phycisphaeraceae bacterium]
MQQHVERVLIDREAIARRVGELAREIAADFRRELPGDVPEITLVPILTGSLIFVADLVRQLPLMMRLRMVTVSSYPGQATSSEGAKIEGRLPEDLSGQHVLVVDDILDSGNTIRLVRAELLKRGAASVRSCMLLRKQIPSAMAEHADYVGFEIPDAFVVGYGLDYDGYYRNLADVVTLKADILGEGEAT